MPILTSEFHSRSASSLPDNGNSRRHPPARTTLASFPIVSSPIVGSMHTRSTLAPFVAEELSANPRLPKPATSTHPANTNKESVAPPIVALSSPTKARPRRSHRSSNRSAPQPSDPSIESAPAMHNLADRVKSHRRVSAKMAAHSEQAQALANLAASFASPSTPKTAPLPPLPPFVPWQQLPHELPQHQSIRSVVEGQFMPKVERQYPSTPIHQRPQTASAASRQAPSQPQVIHVETPQALLKQTENQSKPHRGNEYTPKDQLSQTRGAITSRLQRARHAPSLLPNDPATSEDCTASGNVAPALPIPAHHLPALLEIICSKSTQALSAPQLSVSGPVGSRPSALQLPEARLSVPPLAPSGKPTKIRANTHDEIAKYSKPGEDLDWTNVACAKERKRLQNIIHGRKYHEKRSSGIDVTAKRARPDGHTPLKTSKRIRLHHSSDNEQPHPASELSEAEQLQAQRSSAEPLSGMNPPSALTVEQALALSDDEYMAEVRSVLHARSRGKAHDFALRQARRIFQLLRVATPAGPGEALVCSGEEASLYLETNAYFPGPIFTSGQQGLPLQSLDQFFAEHYDDSVQVYVQDPAVRVAKNMPHVRDVTMSKVKQRFAKPASDKPWNLLELAAHVEDGLRPAFLNTEDCRLLTKLKFPSSGDMASRKGYLEGWKEVEKWALVAQAGALTEPHQDSHGYSTYITVNQGVFGYGWLANPTDAQRAAWNTSHDTFLDGPWRYTVLRPGQTVYFPSGTVHFVFRLPAAGDTLAFGGHILRCSQVVRWVKTLIEEKRALHITNEDLTLSAPGYLDRVERFVKQALRTGQEGKWGGREAIEEFLVLKAEFEGMKKA